MDKYMAALFLPHTEARLFPSVSRILSERARANGEAAQENVH
jgi:hypothetical protein